jgi:diguanylate cyclase (GGDEF)-like protein
VVIGALQGIPEPAAAVIEPRLLASYGALMAAVLLGLLYVYRGRAFIVYWILSWVLISFSLFLLSRGYADARLGGVIVGLAQLLAAWSAGLLLLAAQSFPDAPLRWNVPVRAAAASAVWFLAAPLLLPLRAVLLTGPAIAGFALAWSGLRYFQLFKSTRFAGAALIGGGLLLLAVSSLGTAAIIEGGTAGTLLNRVLAVNIVINIFVALGMHLLVFEDMTAELRRTNRDLAAANEEVRRLAITDPLTGCYNRRFFDQVERREIQRHRRYGSPLSVVFVDVNRFKQLNDTLGHETGDALLRAIGTMLRRQVRSSDYVIRWGGDEFMLLLTCTFPQAERKCAELKAAFHADPQTAGLPGGVGLSTGAAEVFTDSDTLADAIRVADERMYQDKFSQKARVAT